MHGAHEVGGIAFEFEQTRGEGAWAAAFDGRLVAWDPVSESVRWSVEQSIAVNSSTLSTAGNLVFQGEGTGEFSAYAADSGKKLWSIKTGSAIDATPVSFSAGGQQFIVVPVGWGSASRIFGPASMMATPESKRGPSRLLAFKLGGTTPFPYPLNIVPRVPKPPEQTFSRKSSSREKFSTKPTYAAGAILPGSTEAERGRGTGRFPTCDMLRRECTKNGTRLFWPALTGTPVCSALGLTCNFLTSRS